MQANQPAFSRLATALASGDRRHVMLLALEITDPDAENG